MAQKRPTARQLSILRRLPMSRWQIDLLLGKDGRGRPTFRSIQAHGWALWNVVLDELQPTPEGTAATKEGGQP